jgi:LytS/YehU family sensor histidine kinase
MNKLLVCTLCSALMFVSVAHGKTLDTKLIECTEITDSLARLVCFDTLATTVIAKVGTAKENTAAELAATPSLVPGSTPIFVDKQAAVKTDNVAMFGAEHLKKSAVDTKESQQITAVVAKVKKNHYDQLLLTFENGQAWKQTDNSWFKLALGQSVILTKGVMGAVYLKKADGSSNKKIRVKRIK